METHPFRRNSLVRVLDPESPYFSQEGIVELVNGLDARDALVYVVFPGSTTEVSFFARQLVPSGNAQTKDGTPELEDLVLIKKGPYRGTTGILKAIIRKRQCSEDVGVVHFLTAKSHKSLKIEVGQYVEVPMLDLKKIESANESIFSEPLPEGMKRVQVDEYPEVNIFKKQPSTETRGPAVFKMDSSHNIRKSGGSKTDKGKFRWSFLPRWVVRPIANIFQFGGLKYAFCNWRGLEPVGLWDAFERHIEAHSRAVQTLWEIGHLTEGGEITTLGEAVVAKLKQDPRFKGKSDMEVLMGQSLSFYDEESGFPHIDHALATLLMYRHQLMEQPMTILPEASRIAA